MYAMIVFRLIEITVSNLRNISINFTPNIKSNITKREEYCPTLRLECVLLGIEVLSV